VENWPKKREALSRGANTYSRLLLGFHVHDSTGGFRAYRATTLSKIGIDDVTSQGYCFQVDLTLRTVRAGLRVAEVPITFVERTHGASKMSRDIMVEAFVKLTRWGVEGRLGRLTGRRLS
jgi:dolichol-phosphate mannosyltransferase